MRQDILDKRRKEGWRITLWCEPRAVVVQITTPDVEENKSPDVDVACRDLSSALSFAQAVCHSTPEAIERTRVIIPNWLITPEAFLDLLGTQEAAP
jgi:hypothetical protein